MASTKEQNEKKGEQKPQKSQVLILQHTAEAALTQLERNTRGLSLSGFSAGLDIGFSVLLMMVMLTLFNGIFPAPVVELLVANMYPIGFIFVVLGRSELFTEHTTLAILPVLQGLASVKKLLRLWFVVYLSNIIGGLSFAAILSYFIGNLDFLAGWSIEHLVEKYMDYSTKTLILSAALAGWMMGLLAWLVAAARETISQIFIIWLVTAGIGIIGLPHCIVGNIEVATAMFQGKISVAQYFSFLAPVTLGNTLGGAFFVGILKFSHTVNSGKEKDIDPETLNNKD